MSKTNGNTAIKTIETPKLPNINTGIPNYKRFQKILKMTQMELKKYLKDYLVGCGYKVINGNGFLFAKGDVDILLTAHMDTTPTVGGMKRNPPSVIYTSPEGVVSSPQGIGGDDRCGIYIITEIIKETKCSVLFCEDEEIGCVGSELFTASKYLKEIKNMRYMIEVDRRGSSDLVFYDCDNYDFEDFLLDNLPDYKTAWGTCSDISVLMSKSGVAGVNVSSGYHNEHTLDETINLKEMEHTLTELKKLVKIDSPKFEYIECKYVGRGWDFGYGDYGYYGKSKTKYAEDIGLYVVFEKDGKEYENYYEAQTIGEAFYEFFMENADVCMNDVLDWYTDDAIFGSETYGIYN